jgi:serine/threonine-protein kinase
LVDLRRHLTSALADRYAIERELGSGGMATVYLAQDLKHHRRVAIKVLRPEVASSLGAERFLREIQIASQLSHPRIVPLHDSGQADGMLYYVMPYVEGESLRERLNGQRQLSLEEALRITRGVAAALTYAHDHNVMHRDIKPENILLVGGEVVVTDFGIARAISAAGGDVVSHSDLPIGTVGYMSPEQAMGSRDLDGRTDLYGLACVLYEMLVGQPPGMWFDERQSLSERLTGPPPFVRALEGVAPTHVTTVLTRALALYADDRYASVEQFSQALDSRIPAGTDARPDTIVRLQPKFTTGIVVGAAMAVLLIVGSLGMWLRDGEPVAGDGHPRLAVLPFEDRGSAGDEFFAEGTAEAIRNRLAGLSGLTVVAYRHSDEESVGGQAINTIGRDLGVQYLLRGSVQRAELNGGRTFVRVSPELVRVSDASILWADSYEAPLGEIFQLQSDIAERVGRALDVVILAPERKALEFKPTADPEAWSYYASGSHFYHRSAMLDDNRRAATMYQRAVEQDSNFALAYAGLANALVAISMTGGASLDGVERAGIAAEKALALAPDLPEAVLAQANYLYALGKFDRALELAADARRVRPNDFDALYLVAHLQRRLGQWDEAIANLENILELDPRNRPALIALGETHLRMRSYSKADRYFDAAIQLAPDLADAYVLKACLMLNQFGDIDEAVGWLHEGARLGELTDVVEQLVALEPVLAGFKLVNGELRQALLDLPPAAIGGRYERYLLALADANSMLGRSGLARAYYDSLRVATEQRIETEPDCAICHTLLGVAYAGLKRDSAAVREGLKGVELRSVANDAWEGPDNVFGLAHIYAAIGEYETALDQVEILVSVPSRYSTKWFSVHPAWKGIRQHPRFQQVLARGS